MLELEFVELRKPLGALEIGRLTFLFKLDLFAERVLQPPLDQVDCEIGNIDPDPLASELLRSVNGCAASTEWIENNISGIAARADDAFE